MKGMRERRKGGKGREEMRGEWEGRDERGNGREQ